MRLQAKPSQQPGTGDTPDSVCLRQFAASANPQAHEQGRRSRSSPHVPVIFGSPVLRWHRLRRVRPTPLPVGGRRLRSGSYRSAGRAAWRRQFFGRPSTAARDRAFRKCGGGGGVRDWGADRRSVRPVYHRQQTLALDLLPSFGPGSCSWPTGTSCPTS